MFVLLLAQRLVEAVRIQEKHARQDAIDAVNAEAVAHFKHEYAEAPELHWRCQRSAL